jgi:hypothetical protein
VFLGVFEPREGEPDLWTLENDYYLHNREVKEATTVPRPHYIHWATVPDNGFAAVHSFPQSVCEPIDANERLTHQARHRQLTTRQRLHVFASVSQFDDSVLPPPEPADPEAVAVTTSTSPALTLTESAKTKLSPAPPTWHLYIGQVLGVPEVQTPTARVVFHDSVLAPPTFSISKKQQVGFRG